MKKLFTYLIAVLLLTANIGMAKSESLVDTLPLDVTGIDTDMKAFSRLYELLQKIPDDDSTTLAWLEKNTPLMPPIFRYEYSRRLNVTGHREAALTELAKARLARDIDSTECIKIDRNTPGDMWFLLTNMLETGILNKPRRDMDLWYKGISIALNSEVDRKRLSSLWLCGVNNTKDAESINRSRKDRYEFMKRDFEKINAMKLQSSAL